MVYSSRANSGDAKEKEDGKRRATEGRREEFGGDEDWEASRSPYLIKMFGVSSCSLSILYYQIISFVTFTCETSVSETGFHNTVPLQKLCKLWICTKTNLLVSAMSNSFHFYFVAAPLGHNYVGCLHTGHLLIDSDGAGLLLLVKLKLTSPSDLTLRP